MQPGVLARIYFTGRNFLCYKLAISSPTSISLHHGPLPYQGSCIMNSSQKVSGEWHSESFLWPSILYCALSRFSHVQLFATLWTVAHHTPLSVGFCRQEHWSGLLPCPPPGDVPSPGIEPMSLMSPALAGKFFTISASCFIDYDKAFDCADHNKLWKIFQEMGIPDHLTCLLRNLYAGQEATVRTEHGTMDCM